MVKLACILMLLAPAASFATTAASCNNNSGNLAVQIAVNATIGLGGGVVNLPAGSCTWDTVVSWSNAGVPIELRGAGIASTVIVTNTGSSSPINVDACAAIDYVTIDNFTIQPQSTGSSNGMTIVGCSNVFGYPPVALRIHHMKFLGDSADGTTDNSNGPRFVTAAGIYGIIDHNKFWSLTSKGMGNVTMSRDSTASTANDYHIPVTLGDANALYVENNDFQFVVANQGNGATDNYTGARWVFRFNTVTNNNVGNHGWDSQPRGTRSFEVYQNTFTASSGIGAIDMFGPRSGTGMLWGNTVKNIQPMGASQGYISLFTPRYYGALTAYALGGNVNLNARASGYYPTPPWGVLPYSGTSGPIFDGINNYVTGSNPIDGNQYGPGHMDVLTTRTVTDLVTTSGSTTITSATANFNLLNDQPKNIIATNIVAGRIVTDGVTTNSSTTVTSATANFNAGDVGRVIGDTDVHIPHSTTITAVTNSTTVTVSNPASGSASGLALVLGGAYIVSVANATTAVLNVPATASGSGGTLTIGYTDQGYPLADQPGYGSFPSANSGNWPNASSYTAGNYEALSPTYLWTNSWQTVDSMGNILTNTIPPATTSGLAGTEAYVKIHREYYDDPDTPSGTLAARPSTCTAGYAYWATDQGNWNLSGSGGQGVLYKCTATNTWTLYYTPYAYPYPGTGDPTVGSGRLKLR